ncbi:transketolase [Candidatus Daviesbacteria bacterium]|nr:transketolase [Candidatus Daviesbacteria bacterium]
MANLKKLQNLAKLIRYFILLSTTEAGSGHVTSSLSATDLLSTLFFGGFYRFDLKNPGNPNNDRLIFSKGHASPLFYSLFAAAGAIAEEELKTFRKFGSRLEGHPTMEFPFTEAPTGSLGQGLSIGLGMALSAKYIDKLPFKTFVLLGDSEMAEGSVWEAIQIAAHYKLDNLIGILDVNRLGQRGETMYGHDIKAYEKRVSVFGWNTILIDGHNFTEIEQAFKKVQKVKDTPVMIITKTLKGKGISFLENKEDWHGKALKPEEFQKALEELGSVDKKIRGKLILPSKIKSKNSKDKSVIQDSKVEYKLGDMVATRKAYGNTLAKIYPNFLNMVVLDAEVSNSTYADIFKKAYPERFFEMYIAEQNMVGAAVGLSRRGKIPFVSTFAAFFSRAFDQIRMSQYANSNIKFVGSHAGVSIGEDGASQMGLEDIAMFRTLLGSVVLYPSDAVSVEKLVLKAAEHFGNVYIRTTRKETPVLYKNSEQFPIGGSKVLKSDKKDVITVIGAGITLYEALTAYEQLIKENIFIRVIDLYSIKPLDLETLKKALQETQAILTVEDHYLPGGLGEAVLEALTEAEAKIYNMAVTKMPKSGKPAELLEYEEISASAIVRRVKEILHSLSK